VSRNVLIAGVVLAAACLLWADLGKRPMVVTSADGSPNDELWMERREQEARAKKLVPEAGKKGHGTKTITFPELSYTLSPEQEKQGETDGYARWLPPEVKALDGRKVRVEGFMLPMLVKEGKASEFLIMANQLSCCYGQPPRFCDFITAKAASDPVPMVQDRVLVYEGTLHVADTFDGKVWTGLYTLELDSMGR
jgi:hypothetical protein